MIPASLLAALLSVSPPAVQAIEPASEPPAPTLTDTSDADYQSARENVRKAIAAANEDPAAGSTQLRNALNYLESFGPRLAKDLEGQQLRVTAQLTLARALLATNKPEQARDVMDEALRTALGDPLPTKPYGPGLTALHRERAGVLDKQGTGTFEVECHTPCRVFLNERPAKQRIDALVPGNYRVWIEANDGSEPVLQQLVEVEVGGEVELEFGKPREVVEPPPLEPIKPRMLPRWADILLVSAGAAAIGTGAVLWALDGRCPGGDDPNDPIACPQVFITKTAGIITVAAGGALFLSGTIVLAVDEVRAGRQRGTSAALVYTLRF